MKFTRELPGTLTVQSVASDGVHIQGRIWSETIALTPQEVLDNWSKKNVAALELQDFSALLAEKPELIILGTGKRNQFPPRELTFAFARQGIGLDVMDTMAAARTFNVLVSEGRKIAAVLYPTA